jgi:hypothetical protein
MERQNREVVSEKTGECTDTQTAGPAWPVKTRELHTEHFDSTIWNDFAFRSDDIVIAT